MGRTLYLDVDGVICPFGPEGRTGWGSSWQHADAGLLPVAFAPELVAGLNSLARISGLRCVWLTSWEDLAPQYLCPAIHLDGSSWPWLAAAGAGSGPGWWKLLPTSLAQDWARLVGRRILPISPDPRRGISPGELRSVRSFLEHTVF